MPRLLLGPPQPFEIDLAKLECEIAFSHELNPAYKHPVHGRLLAKYIQICQKAEVWLVVTSHELCFVNKDTGEVDKAATEKSYHELVRSRILEQSGDGFVMRQRSDFGGCHFLYQMYPKPGYLL